MYHTQPQFAVTDK